MSSSLGPEFEADFSMDLFVEIAPISILELPEPEDIAMNLTAETLPTTHADQTLVPSSETQSDTSKSSSNSEETIQNMNDSLDYEAFDDLFSLYSDDEGPLEVIIASDDTIFDMRLIVIVSMVPSFPDRAETLIHAGHFLIKVTPTTTIREIKYGITNALQICYEDMALIFVKKFLSDSRTIEYYLINDGQTLHLLVEAPNKLFKDVFEAFKALNLNEEKALFATKSFIHLLHNKRSARNEFGNDQTCALTEELLLHEIERLCVPDSDESDDSSADEDEPSVFYSHVVTAGGTELVFENEEVEEENSEDEEENSEDEQENSEDEEENSEDEEENSEDEEENSEDEDYYSKYSGPLQVTIASDDTIFDMKLIVNVSFVSSFPDRVDTLIQPGDILIKVTPTTTIREIKYGITNALRICYEDMALIFVGKFLSDSCTIQYYLINDGQILHLLVEGTNKLFKDFFEAFKTLNLNEEKALFATKTFIHLLHNKHNARNTFGNYQPGALTEELLLHELERLYVPDSDESDDSSAEEYNSEYEEYNSEYDDNTSEYEDHNSEDDEGNDEMEKVE